MFDVGDIVTIRDDLTEEEKNVAPGWIGGYMNDLIGYPLTIRDITNINCWVHFNDTAYSYNVSWLKYYDDPDDSVELTIHIDELF